MTKKMLIDAAHAEEVRVCVLDNNVVEDFDFESQSRKPLRGNIYLARVTRVEPSLQAAFVEYGGNRHGFLAFNEIHPDYYQVPISDRKLLQEAEDEEAELGAQLDLDEHGEDAGGGGDDEGETGAEQEDGDGGASVDSEDEPDFRDSEAPTPADDEGEDLEDPVADEVPEGPADQDGGRSSAFASGAAETVSIDAPADENPVEENGAEIDPASTEVVDPPGALSDAARDEAAMKAREAAGRLNSQKRAELMERYREARRKRARLLRNYKIQEVIKRRQILLVQVVKEERGNKGAALTTYLSLAGRYCVLMPNTARGGGISRKIPVAADRKRLRRVVDSLDVPKGMGLIIRTAGAKRTKAEIKRDYEYLTRLWENIRTLTMQSIAPCLIYEEASLIKRAIRDLYDKDIDEILVEGDAGYREAKDFMKMLMPSHAKNVQPYKDKTPLFIAENVEGQLDAMYQPVVRLKSGGYIVIHQTEALVAIDVNSGKATRERNIELTALKTNLEAAKEVARQCRLRDLAGLIVIDFIDMEEQRNNRTVEKRFKEALRFDRARLQVGRISNFGLLEMSRQRRRSGIVDGTTHTCPSCNGAGVVRSAETAALRILRAVEREALAARAGVIAARCSLDVTLYILNHKREWLKRIEDDYALTVEIVADPAKAGDVYEIERRGAPRDLAPTLQVVRADQTEAIEVETPDLDEPIEAPDEEDLPEPRRSGGDRERDSGGADSDGGRRRRRRRRGGRRGEEAPRFSHGREGGEPVGEADAGDGKSGADERFEPAEFRAEPRSGEQVEGGERKRRRRGRRGGRRNRGGRPESGEAGALGVVTVGSKTDPNPYDAKPYIDAPYEEVRGEPPRQSIEPVREFEAIEAAAPAREQAPGPATSESPEPEPEREAPHVAALPDTPPKAEKVKRGWWQRAIGG
ncbi:MAG: Rne/Rng family ribonuclease [Parvularculaceae bacterium]|nr:Rne/Rng family ribonuclease [Parvularculaceae bacterium]